MDKGAGHETPLGKSDEQRQNLLKYYQYLAIHKIPEIFSNNLYPPAVNQLLRMIDNQLTFLLLLLFAGLFISYQLILGKKKKTDDLQNLLPVHKQILVLQKYISLFLGSLTICILPMLSVFLAYWWRNGLGRWDYPLKSFPLHTLHLYHAQGLVLNYVLWLCLFLIFFISIGAIVVRLTKSLLLSLFFTLFVLFFSQSQLIFEHPSIAKFLPSTYLFAEKVYTNQSNVHLLGEKVETFTKLHGTADFKLDLFGTLTNHELSFFSSWAG